MSAQSSQMSYSSVKSPGCPIQAFASASVLQAVLTGDFDPLLFLMRHPGQVFSREDLYELIWGLESMGDNITVAVHVGRIREKLEDDPANPKLLQTVWGVGYRLHTAPV